MASSSRPAPSPSPAGSALQPPSPPPPASDLQAVHAIAANPAPLHIPPMAPAHPLHHRFSSLPVRLPPLAADDSTGFSAAGGGSSSCRPASAPASTQPPPFLTKTYDLVDDTGTDAVISWNAGGSGFIVWDSQALCQRLLPRYFRHGNFASFVRQLNTYGFRKIDPERWEFANDDFVRGQRSLLASIRRKKPAGVGTLHHSHFQQFQNALGFSASGMPGSPPEASILNIGRLGFKEELDGLKRQVCRLTHQVEHSEGELQTMCQRLQMSRNCEQHMMAFIIKATRDPSFLSQLVQQPSFESSDMSKRQRIAGPMATSVEGSYRMMDCASAVCDDSNSDQQRASSSAGLQESLQAQQQLSAANLRQMPMPLSPDQLAMQNEAGLMMAAGSLIAQADQGSSLPNSESQTNQSSGGYGAGASCSASFAPRSESSSAFVAPQ